MKAPTQAPGIRLTEIQKSVLLLVAEGKKNAEIASDLEKDEKTIGFHLQSIYKKFGVNNRIQAINKGRELGLI